MAPAIFGFLAFSLGLTAAGLAVHAFRLTWSGRCAKGTVVAVEEVRLPKKAPAFYPVVEFQLGDRVVQFRNPTGGNTAGWHIGARVRVLYPPEAPGEATIDSIYSRWMVVVALVIAAVLAGGAAWALKFL
jgi:hypothetical protein